MTCARAGHQLGAILPWVAVPLDAARRMRWRIEVVGWADSTNSRLRSWLASTGGIFIDLSDHYYSISFIEGGRRVQGITLRHRATAG